MVAHTISKPQYKKKIAQHQRRDQGGKLGGVGQQIGKAGKASRATAKK
jgi:hypothetical protein